MVILPFCVVICPCFNVAWCADIMTVEPHLSALNGTSLIMFGYVK